MGSSAAAGIRPFPYRASSAGAPLLVSRLLDPVGAVPACVALG
jgi:hypothetical protein